MDDLIIVNLIPRFLTFYNQAVQEGADREKRWELWKEHYHFAAIPPGEEGMKLARKLLDESWNKYHDRKSYIQNWEPDQVNVERYLSDIKALLGCEESISLAIIYFVGGFENNAFVAPYDENRIALCLPIECEESNMMLGHELTHVVHSKTANLSVDWERTIASVILQEGLATQVCKYIIPGKSDSAYIDIEEGWLASCNAVRNDILKGIYPYLDETSSETVFKFTMGSGTTNHEREAYFVGWELINYLLEYGKTFKDIAGIQEDEMPDYVRQHFSSLLS